MRECSRHYDILKSTFKTPFNSTPFSSNLWIIMDGMSRHTSASRDFVAGRERSERSEFTLRLLRE